MNLENCKIKSSRKDPENPVYELDGKIFRKIEEQFLSILKNDDLKKFFPSTQLSDFNIASNDHSKYYEVEKIPFIIYPYELPFSLFKDLALNYLTILNKLLDHKYSLKDATPFNLSYLGAKNFKHFDLGSVENFDIDYGWRGYRQFLNEFYFPLVYLSQTKAIYSTDLIKLQFDKQWIFQFQFKLKNFFNPGFNIHYVFFKQSRIKNLDISNNKKQLKIKISQVKNNLLLLQEHIKQLNIPVNKTKWDNYYSKTILQNDYVEKKIEVVKKQLKLIKPEINFATDWGANDGKFSKTITEFFNEATVISIESDYNAINNLYLNNKSEKIIPVYTDILNLSPNLGFDGERIALKSRLNGIVDLQLCLGLIHHLIHQENLSYDLLIKFFSECAKSKSFLIIEFIEENDPRHQLVKNPNFPYSLSRDYFIKSLENHYEILDQTQIIDTRELFLCIKRD